MTATLEAVLGDVAEERCHQDARWGQQNHADGTGGGPRRALADAARATADDHAHKGSLTWLDILDEETCEAFAETDPVLLRAELVQVAAVAVAWIEALDRRAVGGVAA